MCATQYVGQYKGSIRTEWLDDGRQMRLLSTVKYYDPYGVEWSAPEKSIVDGASIPKPVWSFIGSPFAGRYRKASVIHDVACQDKVKRWEDVHETFYWAMLASKVARWKAKVMYAAVYMGGPRWPREIKIVNLPDFKEDFAIDKALSGTNQMNIGRVVRKESSKRRGMAMAPGMKDYVISIEPKPASLNQKDFEHLKEVIKSREQKRGGGMTLEEIQTLAE